MSARPGIEHRFLVASAGSGKTYELTSRLIALLLDGHAPERILATTFTRKAAREILERVLERLVAAARDESRRSELCTAVGRDVTREQALDVLAQLVRHLDRLRVSTLDAYFQRVARVHAFELGLPASWSIADEVEDEETRGEAIAAALAESSSAERLALLRDLQRGAGRSEVHAALSRAMREGLATCAESTADAWDRVMPAPDAAEDEVRQAIARVSTLAVPTNKDKSEPVHWVNARTQCAELAARGDWERFLGLTLVGKVIHGEATFDRKAIPADWSVTLTTLARRALHRLTESLARENRAARALLERFERAYAAAKRERSQLGFEDLPAAIAPAGGADPLGARGVDIAHRLDARIDHVLLDEFQDTAPTQWRVLAPLARSLVSNADGTRSFFCVGDPKQSIYAWRAAEPRLVEHAQRSLGLEPQRLTKSWRSSPLVLDTVHRVFGGLASNAAILRKDQACGEPAVTAFSRTYERHVAAKPELPGAAFLLEACARDDQGTEEAVIALAAKRVAAIVAEAPQATVGVLLRANKHSSKLVYALGELGVRASGEGGNPLTDSPAVLAALSVLQLADHPGDTAAAFHVATSPFGARLGLGPDDSGERRADVARGVRRDLAARGLGAWLADLVREPDPAWTAWDLRRLGQLVDLALAFEPRADSRPAAFVRHARAQAVEDPSAARVRVMTIHKAKGLEFDAVVLPDLNGRLLKPAKGFLTRRADPDGPIDVVSRPLKKELRPHHEFLRVLGEESEARALEEELCVLYVALTRAIHRLEMIVEPPPATGSTALSFANVLRAALVTAPASAPEERDGYRELWAHADNDEIGCARPRPGRSPGAPPATLPPLRLAPSHRPRLLPTNSPSTAATRHHPSVADLLGGDGRAAARGTLIHRWLSEIEWIEDFDASDADLEAIGRALEPDPAVLRDVLRDLRAALARSEVRAALARQPGEVEVWRERRFSLVVDGAQGTPELWTGAFDRVVVRRESGRVVQAQVLDYKTDRLSAGETRARLEHYRPQLEAYRAVVARMTGLDARTIGARALFLFAPEPVADL